MSLFGSSGNSVPFRKGDREDPLRISGSFDAAQAYTQLHLSDGRVLSIETNLLLQKSGSVPLDASQAAEIEANQPDSGESTDRVIPVIHEELVVRKRIVETEKIRLEKTVQQHQESIDVALSSTSYFIERIAFNDPISQVPEVRQEGDITIYPIVEERPVVTKQLFLTEEVRVTKRITESIDTQLVTLRREDIKVRRRPLVGQGVDPV